MRSVLRRLVDLQFDRNDMTLGRGKFRVRGDTIEVHPSYEESVLRIEMFGDTVDRLTVVDPLTGELNRTHLVASLAESIEEAARFRSSFAFMLIGIDHLARINDAFGFDVADAVISEVARRIRARPHAGRCCDARSARP